MFTRILLFLIGFWLLRMVWRQFIGAGRRVPRQPDPGPERKPPQDKAQSPYDSGRIVEAEFEEIDDSKGSKS